MREEKWRGRTIDVSAVVLSSVREFSKGRD